VREAFRLLGELRELGAEPLVWRRHMLESLGRIIGVTVGMSAEGCPTWRVAAKSRRCQRAGRS
jgi:hypothetical protein